MFPLRIGPRAFLLLCRITLVTLLLNVATGAAVRLSDSGLGCPQWPDCSRGRLTPPLRLHPLLEFGNRVVVFLLVVTCIVTAVAAFLRRPTRTDLRWLAGGLILGVLGESVLGAVVVYSHLNPYVVLCHFMMGMALLTVGVVLTLRANHAPGRGEPLVPGRILWLTRGLLGMFVVVLAAGAATTGAGPHAGGKGAKRIPIALVDMTRIHSEVVLATGLLLLVILFLLWRTDAPASVQDAGRIVLAVMAVQGIVGYTQYFTRLPALLVGIHVLGAALLWSTVLWFHHGLSSHRQEDDEAPSTDTPIEGEHPADDGAHRDGADRDGDDRDGDDRDGTPRTPAAVPELA